MKDMPLFFRIFHVCFALLLAVCAVSAVSDGRSGDFILCAIAAYVNAALGKEGAW